MQQDTREYLRDTILASVPGAKLASGGKEIIMRCHRCGDSPDTRKAHMYVGLGNEEKPPMYHCFLCDESGVVDGKFLRERDIYDPNLASRVNSEISKMAKNTGNRILGTETVKLDYRCNYDYCDSNYDKMQYIYNRIGVGFDYPDLNRLKIVLNLCDLLRKNGITEYTRFPNVMEDLNDNYIGFLSTNNCFVNMRNLGRSYGSMDKAPRYLNYNIFGRLNNIGRYYIIPSQIDMSSSSPVEIHIAEGPFDILSIAYNVVKNFDNNIFMALGGKSYLVGIRYFIEHLGLVNMNLNLYVDNDIDIRIIRYAKSYLAPFNVGMRVFRNAYENEKDFGVPKDHIKLQEIRI